MILMIDNYDSFTYNLVQLLATLGAEVEVRRNDAITVDEALMMEPKAIVISPGPGRPVDAGISRELVTAAAEKGVPVLGVCLGHQVIAESLGAQIVRAPKVVHGKTDQIAHEGTGVLIGVPSPFIATRYHSLCVDQASVPQCLRVTATTEDGVIMGIEHTSLPLFGVQFHPESVLTPEGIRILANFLDIAGEVALAGEASGTAAVVAAAGGSVRASVSVAEVESVPQAIARIAAGESLSERESERVMSSIMDGEATDAQISALVMGMRMKGETVDEIVGFARAMRGHATPVRPKAGDCVDVVGTGGDGLHTFNISTTSTFVVAGAGVPVAKHGNRAVSSSAGAADVLEALGVDISLTPDQIARCIDEVGVGFLFAMSLHASMRHAGPARREMGIRTVFNILGPLTNPAGAKRQLLGVYDARLAPTIAEVAGRLGAEHVIVVNGHPGMDEVSASGTTTVAEFADGNVSVYEIEPEQFGIERGSLTDVAGGTPEENASITRQVLSGDEGPKRDVVLLNSGLALVAAGRAASLAEGIALAAKSIDSGAALSKLDELVRVSRQMAADSARAAS